MTVRQLLQHTTGIQDDYPEIGSAEEYYLRRDECLVPEETVARAMALEPLFEPGEGWAYSNTGYVLVGMIIEQVTGARWHDEVARRILVPLGLEDTTWPGTSTTIPEPHAKGYELFEGESEVVDVTRLCDADASGGVISTTADLNRFFRALLSGRLLEPALLAQMQDTIAVDAELDEIWPGVRDGLGLFSRPLPCGGVYWGHNGDQIGYMTRIGVTPYGRRSVVVSISTQLSDSLEHALALDRRASELIEHALCGER
jgi:D-alanyl-D-alanine carboxypeptidase